MSNGHCQTALQQRTMPLSPAPSQREPRLSMDRSAMVLILGQFQIRKVQQVFFTPPPQSQLSIG